MPHLSVTDILAGPRGQARSPEAERHLDTTAAAARRRACALLDYFDRAAAVGDLCR